MLHLDSRAEPMTFVSLELASGTAGNANWEIKGTQLSLEIISNKFSSICYINTKLVSMSVFKNNTIII